MLTKYLLNRLDIVHNLYLMLLDGKLHMVDFQESPNRILDIGTGTGIWAVDMAMCVKTCQTGPEKFDSNLWIGDMSLQRLSALI